MLLFFVYFLGWIKLLSMTISHNNHCWSNIAFDRAVMVGRNSLPSPCSHRVSFPNKQKHCTRSAVFLTFCFSNKCHFLNGILVECTNYWQISLHLLEYIVGGISNFFFPYASMISNSYLKSWELSTRQQYAMQCLVTQYLILRPLAHNLNLK